MTVVKNIIARGGEITAFMLEAINSGELSDIYVNDSLTTKMSKDEFLSKLVYQEGLEIEAWDAGVEYYEGDQIKYNGVVYTAIFDEITSIPSDSPDDWEETPGVGDAVLLLPRQISKFRIMEDVIFDKRRSRLYHKVQSIQLLIPGSETLDQVELPLAVFKYKDLHKLFKENPDKAIWVNRYNSAENKNFADAFEESLALSFFYALKLRELYLIGIKFHSAMPPLQQIYSIYCIDFWGIKYLDVIIPNKV